MTLTLWTTRLLCWRYSSFHITRCTLICHFGRLGNHMYSSIWHRSLNVKRDISNLLVPSIPCPSMHIVGDIPRRICFDTWSAYHDWYLSEKAFEDLFTVKSRGWNRFVCFSTHAFDDRFSYRVHSGGTESFVLFTRGVENAGFSFHLDRCQITC